MPLSASCFHDHVVSPKLLRLAAFTDTPQGGNPAGVWIGEGLPDAEEMQEIAGDVGYSETAFLAELGGGEWLTRYYSPEAEVTFCGHATIAAGVALGERLGPGRYTMQTVAGPVDVEVRATERGFEATLFSVDPDHKPLVGEALDDLLAVFGWSASDLDTSIPPGFGYAGAWHAIVPLDKRRVLATMSYDFGRLKQMMLEGGLTTIQVIHRQSENEFDSRNAFPVGGVVEDPATGAAAAALGAHLRHHRLVRPPADIVIHQGHDMGRPSILRVHIPPAGGIEVSGSAVPIVA